MKMRIFFRERIFLSFVFALVFSSAYSEDPDQREPCNGALMSVAKFVCDENALCYQSDGAFTCVCRDTYSGDGWAAGSGCNKQAEVSQDMPENGRVKSHHRIHSRYVGMWTVGSRRIVPCRGFWAVMFSSVCVRNAVCMQGFRYSTWVKCICRSGSGNGIALNFPSGEGCR